MASFSSDADGSARIGSSKSLRGDLAHRVESTVQVDRADQRLERIREDGAAPLAAGFQLAVAQQHLATEIEAGRDLGE